MFTLALGVIIKFNENFEYFFLKYAPTFKDLLFSDTIFITSIKNEIKIACELWPVRSVGVQVHLN